MKSLAILSFAALFAVTTSVPSHAGWSSATYPAPGPAVSRAHTKALTEAKASEEALWRDQGAKAAEELAIATAKEAAAREQALLKTNALTHAKAVEQEVLWRAALSKAVEKLAICKAKESAARAMSRAVQDEALWKAQNEEDLANAAAADQEALQRAKNINELVKAKEAEELAFARAMETAEAVRAKAAEDEAQFKVKYEETLAKAQAAEEEALWRSKTLVAHEQAREKKLAEEAALWNAKKGQLAVNEAHAQWDDVIVKSWPSPSTHTTPAAPAEGQDYEATAAGDWKSQSARYQRRWTK